MFLLYVICFGARWAKFIDSELNEDDKEKKKEKLNYRSANCYEACNSIFKYITVNANKII